MTDTQKRVYHRRFPARYICWEIAIRVYQSCPSSRFTAAMVGEMVGMGPRAAGQKLMSMEGAGMVHRVDRQYGRGTHTWWEFTPAFRQFMDENGRAYGCV